MLSPSGSVIGQSPGCTDRIVKYMANSPAKNMSSLDSHTMVPTLTMLGRVRECTLLDSKLGTVAVEVTHALWPAPEPDPRSGWLVLRPRDPGRRQAADGPEPPRIRSPA